MGEYGWISLGSNMGNRESYLREAVIQLSKHETVNIIKISNVYETEPVGNMDQGYFLNLVIKISSKLKENELLYELQGIEKIFGRTRTIYWGPRTIDLDLLWYHDLRVQTSVLTLPHPRMFEREFVLIPMLETFSIEDYALQRKVEIELEKIEDKTKIKMLGGLVI